MLSRTLQKVNITDSYYLLRRQGAHLHVSEHQVARVQSRRVEVKPPILKSTGRGMVFRCGGDLQRVQLASVPEILDGLRLGEVYEVLVDVGGHRHSYRRPPRTQLVCSGGTLSLLGALLGSHGKGTYTRCVQTEARHQR